MRAQRRRLLQGAAALTFAPALLRHARADDAPHFALGIASGQPRADGVELWTKLTGAGLPERVTRCSPPRRSAGSPRAGTHRPPWNLLAQQTLMARLSSTAPTNAGGTYRNDGWDGYPTARQGLLDGVAQRKLPGIVVLGGDVHCHLVDDLKADFDVPEAKVIASAFCGTSITGLSMAQSRLDAMRPFNPHVHHARSDQRGSVRSTLDATQLHAQLRVVDNALDPASGVWTAARFVVEAARPGAVAA